MLSRAIESVFSQTFYDYELIVVDDASTDATDELIETFSNRIIYFKQAWSGVSAARNKGILGSNSPWIAFLDSDDQWLPDKLINHAEYIRENATVRIHQTEEIWFRRDRRVNPARKHIKSDGYIFEQSLLRCMISPSAVCMDRGLFEEYGLFDEHLPACEDYDLWLRITAFEHIGLINKNLIIRYAGHNDQLSSLYTAMDRFRVYSILKLLNNYAGGLSRDQIMRSKEIVLKKTKILLEGCLKRNNTAGGDILKKIITSLDEETYSSIDYQSLASGQCPFQNSHA
jgi:glycosyltransferase involved in cell wall biosynthesis